MTVQKIAVVGCGGISRVHLSAYTAHPERVEVVAACDPLPERTAWARETYGIERTYSSVAEMVDAGGWDVAVVCTPSSVRKDALAELARAGKHILVEKPLSDNVDDAREIVETCEKAGVILAVNQNFRDQYSFGIARKLIEDGRIGEVLGIDQQDLTFRQDKGWRLGMARHAMSVMGVHWFDGFRVLLGREATWVSCRTFSSPAIESAGETDGFVQIHFGDIPVSYVQSFSSSRKHVETIVFGDRGTLSLNYDSATVLTPDGASETIPNPYAGDQRRESMFRSLDRLLTAIESGGEPSNSGRDNLRTVALLDAAYRSAEQRTPIELVEGLPW
ncbi:Gfo/Idh/MocA family protein [Actinopolymorpha pittospori]|uniref:Dehydrogenase n=1 Tax=Actinopolymorpha pittospori TaxID=648752 RepID=A0A927R934_9ACTN|nr:Gfo/Idh/MocA family oxidoreductase [Actinopolymorpha pittospori]MBE1607382.1 putative dehydrogenase [Actinopolymorpha pittospori]